MTYNNIIDVYNRLVDVSNQLHEEHSFEVKGFDKALFTLKYALKQYVSLNLHLENKILKRQLDQLENIQCKLKESNISRDAALQENKRLRSEINVLNIRLNSLKQVYDKSSKNKILK